MNQNKEIEVVQLMINIYCKSHKKQESIEQECEELLEYVKKRREKCPFKENKPFCSNCKIHCYQKDMQEKIKKVMRYSGPRMIFYHPILAIKHFFARHKNLK